MKRMATALCGMVLSAALMAPPRAVRADDFDETEAHPLRLVAYIGHPVGFIAEWLVVRPFHAFVSLPYVREVFGHRPHTN